jgi:predicted signal transduction protein with EAL and GGDEF domain
LAPFEVIDLARNLGKQVCAEGVETEEQWNRLYEMGCDLAQGYWISRPLPADGLMKWLTDSFWGMKEEMSLSEAPRKSLRSGRGTQRAPKQNGASNATPSS